MASLRSLLLGVGFLVCFIGYRREELVEIGVGRLVVDVVGVGVVDGKLVGELADALVDVRYWLDVDDRRIHGRDERLHHNLIVGHRGLILDVDAVELRIARGGTLHGLRVLALLRHLVGLEDHLVVAPPVVVA